MQTFLRELDLDDVPEVQVCGSTGPACKHACMHLACQVQSQKGQATRLHLTIDAPAMSQHVQAPEMTQQYKI
jgi:hypothetical protein